MTCYCCNEKEDATLEKKSGKPIERTGEQLIECPMALCNSDGTPCKGQKNYVTQSLESRHNAASPPVIMTTQPVGWIQECSILEGMLLINTIPLRTHKTFSKFLMQWFILTQFSKGSTEVHVIFYTPRPLANTPKYFEQQRRDAIVKLPQQHCCDTIQTNTKVTKGKWHNNFINHLECKQSLVPFLGNYFVHNIQAYLKSHETLYIAGAFYGEAIDSAWYVHGQNRAQPDPSYHCNAEETDTRVWLYVRNTRHTNILILSSDTDIYHIGVALQSIRDKHIVVQINKLSSQQHLNVLVNALQNDPALNQQCNHRYCKLYMLLQVVTTLPFFSTIGKATFLRYFFHYARFITSGAGSVAPGTLAEIDLNDNYN